MNQGIMHRLSTLESLLGTDVEEKDEGLSISDVIFHHAAPGQDEPTPTTLTRPLTPAEVTILQCSDFELFRCPPLAELTPALESADHCKRFRQCPGPEFDG